MTHAETVLWKQLRARRFAELKFRRQHPIGRFIVDFYCARYRLVIEIDGEVHRGQVARDAARTAWLRARGYVVIRFENRQIEQDLDHVLGRIAIACGVASPWTRP